MIRLNLLAIPITWTADPAATVPFPIAHSCLSSSSSSSSAYAPLCLAIYCANVVTATVEAHLWCRCHSRRWCSCSCSFLDATSSSITANCHQLSVVIGQGIARPRPETWPGRARPRAAPTWAGAVLQLSLRTWNAVRGTWSCHMLFLPMPNMKMQMITKFITIAAMIVAMIRWRWRWLVAAAAAHFVIIFMWENVVVVASENDLRRGRSLINFNWLCWAGFHLQTLRASTSRLLQLQLLLLPLVVWHIAKSLPHNKTNDNSNNNSDKHDEKPRQWTFNYQTRFVKKIFKLSIAKWEKSRKGEEKNGGKTLTIVLRRNASGVPNPIQSPGRYEYYR